MIVTELYNGQGLGNQLWSYVITRTIALDKGFEFGIMSPDKFKGKEFFDLDFGKEVRGGQGPEGGPPITLPESICHYFIEKDTWYEKYRCDVRDYDSELLKIEDNTKIEGYFQSEKFISHRKNEIRRWLKVKVEFDFYDFSSDEICILNIRGGEYKWNPELILQKKYWTDAIANMLQIKKSLNFVIITDDVKYTQALLPQYPSYHFSIGKDYSIVKNARYLILANSSFSFFPAWTSETVKYVIAPKYWARHNISDGFWACAFNLYKDWMWQDKSGALFSYDECSSEYAKYKAEHKLESMPGRPPEYPKSSLKKLLFRARQFASSTKKKWLGF
jgi:hypothetical protein